MERLFISFVGGIAIPQTLFFVLALTGQFLSPSTLVYLEPFSWLISWPEFLLPRAAFHNVGNVILAYLFGNFIAYSLLTYAVLRLWERSRKTKLP